MHLGLKVHRWATNRGESLGLFVAIHDVGEPQTRGGLARQFIAVKGALAETSVETDRRRVTLIIGRLNYSAEFTTNSAVQSEVGVV